MVKNYISLKRDMNWKGHFCDNGIHQGDWGDTRKNSQKMSFFFPHCLNFFSDYRKNLGLYKKYTF